MTKEEQLLFDERAERLNDYRNTLAARDEQIAGLKRELEEARRFSIESLVKILQKADETNGKCFVEEFLQIKQRAETAEARVKELEAEVKRVWQLDSDKQDACHESGYNDAKDVEDTLRQNWENAEARVKDLISAAEPVITLTFPPGKPTWIESQYPILAGHIRTLAAAVQKAKGDS